MTAASLTTALGLLHDCEDGLIAAGVEAREAAAALEGSRRDRADELVQKLDDAQAHIAKLIIVATGDRNAQ